MPMKNKNDVVVLYQTYCCGIINWFNCFRRSLSISAAAAAAKSLQSCPTRCDPINGSPPGSTISGSLQARTLEWCREPAREFPAMTRSCGRALTGKVSQGSRGPLILPEHLPQNQNLSVLLFHDFHQLFWHLEGLSLTTFLCKKINLEL